MSRLQIRVCAGGMAAGNQDCPNAAQHQPHPTGYVSHSNWADDALIVATQAQCPGCGGLELWVPKRPDLRIVKDWPGACCDWGRCEADSVGERFDPEHGWLTVCAEHVRVKS